MPPPGYVIEEYFISGRAKRYKIAAAPAGAGLADSRTAPFNTRLLTVRPSTPAAFNGIVLVEWLNVSSGTDAAPEWSYLHREIVRGGYAYIGVSAQKIGLEGSNTGIPGILPLKQADPDRYARLKHPGDAYAFDIFSQASRLALVTGQGGILGELSSRHVIAMGESQSASFLTTYVNVIDPLDKIFDGFLVHSRFRGATPINGNYVPSSQNRDPNYTGLNVIISPCVRVPVLMFITETDLMAPLIGYLPARQADTGLIRTWEVAGTAHADTYVMLGAAIDTGTAPIEALATAFTPISTFFGQVLDSPMNAAPQHHYVLQAALNALAKWVSTGQAPASAPRLAANDGLRPSLMTDALGNALGGVRSPWVDVPTARLSGLGQSPGGFAMLFGSTSPFDSRTLARLYPGGWQEYSRKFSAALSDAISAGHILAADQAEILALAAALWPRQILEN
nr:alpha/beta hydrolase domain-containing protein [Acidocella aquatica]